MATFTIDGAAVRDIPSFYDEINRVFMADEEWQLGPSLDALNDLLHGGLSQPQIYSEEHFRTLLDQLQAGTGATYFDVIIDIFADHPEIDLVLC